MRAAGPGSSSSTFCASASLLTVAQAMPSMCGAGYPVPCDEDARKVAQPAGARRRPSMEEHGRRSSEDEGDGGAPPASPPPTGAAPSHQRTPSSSGRKLVAGGKSKPFWETREAKRQGVRA